MIHLRKSKTGPKNEAEATKTSERYICENCEDVIFVRDRVKQAEICLKMAQVSRLAFLSFNPAFLANCSLVAQN